jgi:hypothetical protein
LAIDLDFDRGLATTAKLGQQQAEWQRAVLEQALQEYCVSSGWEDRLELPVRLKVPQQAVLPLAVWLQVRSCRTVLQSAVSLLLLAVEQVYQPVPAGRGDDAAQIRGFPRVRGDAAQIRGFPRVRDEVQRYDARSLDWPNLMNIPLRCRDLLLANLFFAETTARG